MSVEDRETLKAAFETGAIPTQADFANLIDSSLNQADDGVVKLPGDPLSVNAVGTEEGLLNFYRLDDGNEKRTSWQLKQKPGGKTGLSIHDASAAPPAPALPSRLFIESGTGNVGIGTTEPDAQLSLGSWGSGDAGPANGTQLLLSGTHNSGTNVGAADNPAYKLKIEGYDNDGTEVFPIYVKDENHQVDFWIKNRQSRFGSPTMYFAGDVGIGTGEAKPQARLQVTGGAIMPAAGNSATAGIYFPVNPGGGRGDAAWIRYYARSGESTTFEIGTSNDRDDHIALVPSGNVGIGTTAPDYKLDVNGRMRVKGTNALVIQGTANTDSASTSLDALNDSVLIVGGCWADQVYLYWKDHRGNKYKATIKGTSFA